MSGPLQEEWGNGRTRYILIGLNLNDLPDRSLVTWFRFIIKQIIRKATKEGEYAWNEMSFHTKWTSRSATTLCFDLPGSAQDRILLTLSRQDHATLLDIYSIQVIILDEMICLFDKSVWAIRDAVRKVEKVNFNMENIC